MEATEKETQRGQENRIICPDCEFGLPASLTRRTFLQTASAAAASSALPVLWAVPKAAAAPSPTSTSETAVKALYDALTEKQKKVICFDWNYQDPKRGLLRTYVSNNWHITPHAISSDFFTPKQRHLIHDVFKSLFSPEWYPKIVQQLKDDTGGQTWGAQQNIAIFGKPDGGKFELVMTGRHLTIRADGNSEAHVAFGGPIFHGHAASGFNEKVHHPGNVFWHQAVTANQVFAMLDGKQRKQALVENRPEESDVPFRGPQGEFPGIPIAELSPDQRAVVMKVLDTLIEPYRAEDRREATECLKAQGGLEKCSLAFYKEDDLGDDGEWDNWRVEGPAFVWYFRGTPHVHIWINVADSPSIELNTG
jgi:hypothetical protein